MAAVARAGAQLAPATLRELRDAALADEHGAKLTGRSRSTRWPDAHRAKEITRMHLVAYRDRPRGRCARWCSPTACTATSTSTPRSVRARAGALLRQHLELRRPRQPDPERRATTSRIEIAGRPLIVVRHTDGSVRVLMNRCAHKGSRLVSAPCGNTGKFFRCPYHAWTYRTDGSLLRDPAEERLRGHAAARMRSRPRAWSRSSNVRALPRLHLREDQRRRPRLRGVLRRRRCPRSTTWPTARPKASSRSPAGACASCTSATGRCSSRT